MGVKLRLIVYGGLLAGYACLASLIRLGGEAWWGIGGLALAITAALGILRKPLPWKEIFCVGVACRLILFPSPPLLSADVYRYLWDGALQNEGFNPYHFAPGDAALVQYHDTALFAKVRLTSADYFSVYPPVSQGVFRLGAWLSSHGFWENPQKAAVVLKALLGAAELMALWAVCRFCRTRFVPLLYAWNPLVILETWGQGHSEALALGCLGAALWAHRTHRLGWTAAFLTLSGWVKLYPLLFLPVLALVPPFSWRKLLTVGGVSAILTVLLWLPFADSTALAHFKTALDLYTGRFEFNAAPYYVLKAFFGTFAGSLLQWCWLAYAVRCWLAMARGCCRAGQGIFWITMSAVILATTVHPWYFLISLFALAAANRRPPHHWLWLSGGSLFTYLFYPYPSVYPSIVLVLWAVWLTIFCVELHSHPRQAVAGAGEDRPLHGCSLPFFQKRTARQAAPRIPSPNPAPQDIELAKPRAAITVTTSEITIEGQ